MDKLTKKLDLKQILLQLYNFDVNMTKVLEKLQIQASKETQFNIFDKD